MREGWAWAVPAPTPGVLIPRTDQAVVTAVAMGVVRVMEAPPVTGVVPALAWATVVSVATGPGPVTVRVMGVVVPGTKEALVMDAAPVTEVVPALAWATVVAQVTDAVRVTDTNLATNRIRVGDAGCNPYGYRPHEFILITRSAVRACPGEPKNAKAGVLDAGLFCARVMDRPNREIGGRTVTTSGVNPS